MDTFKRDQMLQDIINRQIELERCLLMDPDERLIVYGTRGALLMVRGSLALAKSLRDTLNQVEEVK